MMFIVRSAGDKPTSPSLRIKAEWKTPEIVPSGTGKADYFCVGDDEDIAAPRAAGCEVVGLRDGSYADDTGGGIGIAGHGKYWEVRDTPFTLREAAGSAGPPDTAGADGDLVNIRRAIFGV